MTLDQIFERYPNIAQRTIVRELERLIDLGYVLLSSDTGLLWATDEGLAALDRFNRIAETV